MPETYEHHYSAPEGHHPDCDGDFAHDGLCKTPMVRKALAHIKRCDDIFDGRGVKPDQEFAYHQMRQLALELLEEAQK